MDILYEELTYNLRYHNYEHVQQLINKSNITNCDIRDYYSLMVNLTIIYFNKQINKQYVIPLYISQINTDDIDHYLIQYQYNKLLGKQCVNGIYCEKKYPISYFDIVCKNFSAYTLEDFNMAHKKAIKNCATELQQYVINMQYEMVMLLAHFNNYETVTINIPNFMRYQFEYLDNIIDNSPKYKEKLCTKNIIKIQYISTILYHMVINVKYVNYRVKTEIIKMTQEYLLLIPTSHVTYDYISNGVDTLVATLDLNTYLRNGLEILKTSFEYDIYINVMNILCKRKNIALLKDLYNKHNSAFVSHTNYNINVVRRDALTQRINDIM